MKLFTPGFSKAKSQSIIKKKKKGTQLQHTTSNPCSRQTILHKAQYIAKSKTHFRDAVKEYKRFNK